MSDKLTDFEELMAQIGVCSKQPSNPLDEIKALLPLILESVDDVDEIISISVDKLGPVVEKYAQRMADFHAKQDRYAILEYVDKGFTREEALQLVVANKGMIQNVMRSTKIQK